MKKIFAFLVLYSLLYYSAFAQRNTIIIIADDLSPDYFGFYENHGDTVPVPHIRSLLSKGIRFKNLMSNPVCSATRASILTGRYGFRTGVGYIVGSTGGSGTLDTAEITIPKLLKQHNSNIARANIGKWHLHNPTPAWNLLNPIALGYEHYEGPFIGALPSYTNWTKYTNGVASNVTNYATSENVDNAVSWLKSINANQPFFLWLAFNAPHTPLHLPPANLQSYNLSGTAIDIQQNPKNYFKAMIQAMDHEMGRFFDSLQILNRLDSTDIIFIGDNGNTIKTAQISDTSKAKGTVYQYGVHVPCIIAGPSVVSPNRVSNALINTVDLFATIVENFGYYNWQSQIPTNKTVDSKSLQPIIKNNTDSIRQWTFCELFKNIPDADDGKAIRNRDYKLIRFDNGTEEFYNLNLDMYESNNLLNGVTNAVDISNYQFLCNQLNLLTGINYSCTALNINDIANQNMNIFPNPFSNKIEISELKNTDVIMYNSLGTIVYQGKNIQDQDFTALHAGIYFIKIENAKTYKIVKN